MRSRTGCLTCRQRKLKCDETRPICGQCSKANRQCEPSDGLTFRHQHNASMNSAGDSATPLNGFYAYKNTFDDKTVWVDIPKDLTFYNTMDPYNDDLGSPLGEGMATIHDDSPYIDTRENQWMADGQSRQTSELNVHGLEALSAAALYTPTQANMISNPTITHTQEGLFQSNTLPGHSSTQLASPPSTLSSNNNLNHILNPSPSADSSIDPSLMSPTGQEMLAQLQDNSEASLPGVPTVTRRKEDQASGGVESEHKVAYLLRHFSESPGQWMDLFDLGCYFSHHVPVQALSHPLLKHAACAYAAKQLGRAKGKKAVYGGVTGLQANMEMYEDLFVDWEWEGAVHYDKSINLLKEVIQDEHATRSDEVVAATAILSVYEFISATGAAWSRHLNGTKSLLDIVEDSMMPVELPGFNFTMFSPRRQPSTARRATFWNFARQDYIAAFINDCHTRLDTEDLQIWRDAGLQLTSEGNVVPSIVTRRTILDAETMGEDMYANALVWLTSRICNYLATGEAFNAAPAGDRAETPRTEIGTIGESQKSLLERWYALSRALDNWFNGLPATFKPSARIKARNQPSDGATSDIDSPFSEVWYVIPMCAATMQHYHMARVLLLVNKPHETTAGRITIGDRIGSYRSIDREATRHCYEICGISLSRPPASVRVHSTQPLFVAGQYFEGRRERRVVLELLKGIKEDLGWSTGDRVQQLLRQWGWDDG